MKPIYLVLLVLVSGAYLMWTGISDMVFTARARSWPTVQGTVHAKDVWIRSGSHGSKDFIPTMRYYYELNGTAYTAEKIRHDNMSADSKTEALDMISAYSVGMPTIVHYDTHNPASAVLQIGSLSRGLSKLGIGLGVLLMGLLIGQPVWKKLNSNNFYTSSEGG